ncbi:hypothetical protein J2S49_001598 [Arcanobacterium wilhelmae]|uniref:Uncharacterized protein n=1 Tax=Arcanobacterium wilhelmae TaxID=1803177 RepID=A0ABT9NCR7_9ACTO|nr:hypothetical protein [Arcanobacterium wilhelmae]MDP9801522.1 hypothetical protein [Arcanobacterium wilhelmae]WFN90852.1 hypothetical protein P8A24_03070 [Arcanobacterium wilhelmae]
MKTVGWWILVVCLFLIVFPCMLALAFGLMLAGVLAPIAGIGNVLAHLAGWQIHLFAPGTVPLSPWLALPASLLIGVLLVVLGWLLWKSSVGLYRWIMRVKP